MKLNTAQNVGFESLSLSYTMPPFTN